MVVSDWIEHDGKGMPVDGETFVLVRWSDGQEESGESFGFSDADKANYWHDEFYGFNAWKSDSMGGFITHYRIVTPDA